MRSIEIKSSLIARNTLLNFIGQVVSLLIGVVTIPFIVRGLGTERFGLLSLAWVILGYFAIFDLGLGRATTKFVAEALGKGEEDQIPRLVWTAVTAQAVFGLLGALVLVGITPLLVERIFNIPMELVGEAKGMFYLLALSIPVVLVSSSFSGMLEAKQRFDLVNAVRVPASISTYLLTLLGLILGLRLPGIVALILVSRFGALSALVTLDLRVVPKLRKFSAHFALSPHLFAFGGWVIVTSVVGPILVYLDRFLIASLLSIAAVVYYAAPYEAITRLWVIPTSLVATLFPAFSALEGIGDRQRIGTLFARAIKYTLLTLGPIVLMLALFAEEILRIWLGSDFAMQSAIVLQILALGVLVNSLAHSPYALLQGVGRPDITAKFHLLELLFYVGIAWVLVSHWGIAGAATAWTLRVALDALLLFAASFKVCRLSPRSLATNGVTLTGMALLLLAGIAYGLKSLTSSLPLFAQSMLFLTFFGLFAWVIWRNLLDASDRRAVLKVVNLWKEP
ncbi:MAG: oligosaccharide flippase family protein [Nitrospirota bacterium]